MAYIPGRIGVDQKVADRWADYCTKNSFHNSKANMGGGKPNEQTQANNRYTPRDRSCNCGPIGRYPGSHDDRNG
jgi:hypothetical protein